MLEIKLERALEPEMMERQPCGMCGVEFQPEAVLIAVNIAGKYLDETILCEPCLYHLGLRARDLGGASPPDWDWDLVYYRQAVAKYSEPVFPTVAALMEFEDSDPHWNKITPMMEV